MILGAHMPIHSICAFRQDTVSNLNIIVTFGVAKVEMNLYSALFEIICSLPEESER